MTLGSRSAVRDVGGPEFIQLRRVGQLAVDLEAAAATRFRTEARLKAARRLIGDRCQLGWQYAPGPLAIPRQRE